MDLAPLGRGSRSDSNEFCLCHTITCFPLLLFHHFCGTRYYRSHRVPCRLYRTAWLFSADPFRNSSPPRGCPNVLSGAITSLTVGEGSCKEGWIGRSEVSDGYLILDFFGNLRVPLLYSSNRRLPLPPPFVLFLLGEADDHHVRPHHPQRRRRRHRRRQRQQVPQHLFFGTLSSCSC